MLAIGHDEQVVGHVPVVRPMVYPSTSRIVTRGLLLVK